MSMLSERTEVAVIRLHGEYDMDREGELIALLLADVGADTVVGDMTDVTFVDSSALNAFVTVRRQLADEGRHLRLTNLTPGASRLLELTGLTCLTSSE